MRGQDWQCPSDCHSTKTIGTMHSAEVETLCRDHLAAQEAGRDGVRGQQDQAVTGSGVTDRLGLDASVHHWYDVATSG